MTELPKGIVWKYFYRISSIPRESGKESKIRDELLKIATENGWQATSDSIGNIIIYVPGVGYSKNAETVILQAHMDMVCEKTPEKIHDFNNDPLTLIREDENWVTADGTTLGADCGIGMALALAVAENNTQDRVPLELLFTVDEERGLTGAVKLDPSNLKGHTLINLDGDEWGTFIVGCAGGMRINVEFKIDSASNKYQAFQCKLTGFSGGHSGVEIHLRENPIIKAAEIISMFENIRLHAIDGGTKMNAIPRDCTFVVSGCQETDLIKAAECVLDQIKKIEPNAGFNIEIIDTELPELPGEIIECINDIPNGVIERNQINNECVETSSNLGIVKTVSDKVLITFMPRFTDDASKRMLEEKFTKSVEKHHGKIVFDSAYAGWKSRKTKILNIALKTYREIFNSEPEIKSIHAGLEAGIIGDKTGITELLSLSTTIRGMHSPNERLNIKSVENAYKLLNRILQYSPD